jgi:hypothetical protein
MHSKCIIHVTNLLSDEELPTTVYVAPQCSCSSSVILASALSVLTTALLASVTFVLVQVAVCKCHPKFTPGGAETGASTGGEGLEYEQVDVGEMAWTRDQEQAGEGDPTYMEVGGADEGSAIELKENDAYGSRAV